MSNRATVVPHAVDIFLLCIVHQKKHIMSVGSTTKNLLHMGISPSNSCAVLDRGQESPYKAAVFERRLFFGENPIIKS